MKRRGRDFRLNLELAFDAIAQDKKRAIRFLF